MLAPVAGLFIAACVWLAPHVMLESAAWLALAAQVALGVVAIGVAWGAGR